MSSPPTTPKAGSAPFGLSREGCATRRQRLWNTLPSDCQAVLLFEPENLTYLAGYTPSPFVFRSLGATAALLLLPDRSILFGDNVARRFLEEAHADEIRIVPWYDGKTSAPPRRLAVQEAVAKTVEALALSRIAAESRFRSLASPPPAVLVDPLLHELRRSKDPDEWTLLNRSMRAGEAAHAAAFAQIAPGMSEMDAFRIVQQAACQALGEPAWVYGDFVSGERCARDRGGPPSNRVIQRGDLVLLDFSVVVGGYRGDFTNTLVAGGNPSPSQRDLEALCLEALAAGEAALRAGTPARAVDAQIRRCFANRGLEDAFPTHSGHGLGLGHPEAPFLVRESSETLRVGDLVALEPGLYIPGVAGMRFERNYQITENGFVLLSHHHLGLTP
jgi:Xaa-Pro aminopeptidase